MISEQKEQAEVLRIGLIAGYREVSDAVRWADGVIEIDPDPDIEVIDVATGSSLSRGEIIDRLAAVPGTWDQISVGRRVLGELLTLLDSDPGLGERIARWLYKMHSDLPEEEFGYEPRFLDDYFGSGQSHETAVHELRRYLTAQSQRP